MNTLIIILLIIIIIGIVIGVIIISKNKPSEKNDSSVQLLFNQKEQNPDNEEDWIYTLKNYLGKLV